MLINTLMR